VFIACSREFGRQLEVTFAQTFRVYVRGTDYCQCLNMRNVRCTHQLRTLKIHLKIHKKKKTKLRLTVVHWYKVRYYNAIDRYQSL
jgi:hypothetical protein